MFLIKMDKVWWVFVSNPIVLFVLQRGSVLREK